MSDILTATDTPEEAHEAYLDAKRKFHPFNTLQVAPCKNTTRAK